MFSEILEEIPEEKIKSIWKPMSELPNYLCTIITQGGEIACYYPPREPGLLDKGAAFAQTLSGFKTEIGNKFCYLTDYINNIEERLTKLENK